MTYFYSSIISGIEEVARENGYHIIIKSSQEFHEKAKVSLQNLLDLRVDGLFVCLAQDASSHADFDVIKRSEVPLVFFDRVCQVNEFSLVIIDNIAAAHDLTVHLVEKGYRKIAHIAGPENLNISMERIEGYKLVLKKCGLPFHSQYFFHCDLSISQAASVTETLLSLQNPPDAIFGINDTVIFSAMKVIKKNKLKVPYYIGLVGFTDEFHATVVEPNLTAIAHPTFEMGKEALKLVLDEINSGISLETRQVVMKPKLMIRDSSNPELVPQ